jgi:transcriptional regulator with XRE-family HTH domain
VRKIYYENFEKVINGKGITPYRVAKDTGIATGTIYDWKNNRTTPKIDKITKIASYLGVAVNELIKEE